MATWLEAITGPLGAATKSLQELMEVRDLVKFVDIQENAWGDLGRAEQRNVRLSA
jgi:hypothetical protein